MDLAIFLAIAIASILLVSALGFKAILFDTTTNNTKKTRFPLLLIIALFISIPSAGIYYLIGEPDVLTKKWLTKQVDQNQLEVLLKEVKNKLADDKDNIDAWLLLARGQASIEDYKSAIESYKNALRLDDDNPSIMASLADAYIINNGGTINDDAFKLLKKAYEISPELPSAIWLLAVAYEQKNNIKEAIKYWQKLLAMVEDNQPVKDEVLANIKRLSLGDFSYKLRINIDPSLVQEIAPETTIFIIAQEPDGMPMPIVATKAKYKDIPLDIELHNYQSLSINRSLASFQKVKLTARVSISDESTPQKGDIYGSVYVDKNQEQANIIMDKLYK